MKGINLGNKNGMWAGDNVSYSKLHAWVRRHFPLPPQSRCECCGEIKALEVANKSGKYKRDLSDWEWLCRSCHMTKDGRIEKLQKNNESKKLPKTICVKCGILFQPKNKNSKYHSRDCWKKRKQ